VNLHHSGGTGGSLAKPSLKTSSIVCGVALCVILLELAAGGLAKKANIWTLSLAPYLSGAALANASDAVVLPAPTIFAPGVISGPGNDGYA
jgi:hypothetical protein